MANEVSVEITIEEKAALKALTKLSKGIDSTTKDATKSVKKMDGAFASFAGNLAADFVGKGIGVATAAVKDFIGGSVAAAAQVEKLSTQFQILTGDAKVAADLFQELTDFSATTPFQLNNIAEAGAQLLSFGFAADTVKDRIQNIGDVAAGSNSDLKEVSLIYGQVAAAGKLTGERLLQFQERAIPIGPAIAKTMGIAESSVKDMVSKGKVDFETFEAAFNSMSATGGMFEGAIQKQSKTVNGAISTMSDNFDIMQAALGKAFAPTIVETAGSLSETMQKMTKTFAENGPAMSKVLSKLAEVLIITPSSFWADAFGGSGPSSNMAELNAEIAKFEGQLKLVTADYDKQKDNSFAKFIGSDQESAQAMGDFMEKLTILKKKRDELIAQDKTINNIASDEMRKFAGAEGGEVAVAAPEASDPKEDARVLKEQAVIAEINMLRAEQEIAEQERALLIKESQGLATEDDLVVLQELEATKISIRAQGELAKSDLLKTARERELAEQKIAVKTSLDLEKLETKQTIDEIKRRKMLEDQISRAKLQTAGNFINAGLALAKEGSGAQKVLLTANAAMATYSAASQALAAPPGPPWSFALAASTVAMGLANVAKINGVGFANGGVVGGFVGATPGPDNTTAAASNIGLRTGEMVLTSTDQKTLFDNIRSGQAGGGSEGMSEAVMALASQPIIVQIDNKEVARATRDAQRDGFQVAS